MSGPSKDRELLGLLVLSGLFVASLVVCNLIAQKFIELDLGFKEFTISAGILPYPLTFLITDILSEVYGKRRANQVVVVGLVASVMVIGVIQLALSFAAIEGSPVSDPQFAAVFGQAWRLIAASMVAYLAAQLLDVQLFHFWKAKTRGRHLWLRNNASTVCSQLVDTILVIGILFYDKPDADIVGMIFDGWLFKTLCALLDTPLVYLAVGLIRRHVKVPEAT